MIAEAVFGLKMISFIAKPIGKLTSFCQSIPDYIDSDKKLKQDFEFLNLG